MPVNSNLMNQLEDRQQKAQKSVARMEPPFAKSTSGVPKPTSVVNVELAIEYDPLLQGLFRYNLFTWEIELTRDVPVMSLHKGQMLDTYNSMILAELERVWNITFSDRALEHGIIALSHQQEINPVTDYLESCEKAWDGVTRFPTFMSTYLGVEESDVTSLIVSLWAVGAVSKAFNPSVKFDYVLDLAGGQGAGKTTLLEKLAHGFYTDQFQDFKNKDFYSTMLRAWIVNDDEMTATAASSFPELKKFITARVLEFRPPYAHSSIRRDKGFVLARTTNEVDYLKDKTGERRFLPLLVDKSKQEKHPVTDLTDDDVQQFWGEAMALYRNHFSLDVTKMQEQMLDAHREQFMYTDEVETEIDNVLATWTQDFITSKQIGENMGIDDLVKNPKAARKINYVMNNRIGWERGKGTVGKSTTNRRGWRKTSSKGDT